MSSKIDEENSFSLFWKCLLISAAIHVALLTLLIQRPVWLSSLWHTFLGKMPSRTIDLAAIGNGVLDTSDTTFDVFFTERPAFKPYDSPQEISGDSHPILDPQEKYISFSLNASHLLTSPGTTTPNWLTTNLKPIQPEELDQQITFSHPAITPEAIPEGKTGNMLHELVAVAIPPIVEEGRDPVEAVIATYTYEDISFTLDPIHPVLEVLEPRNITPHLQLEYSNLSVSPPALYPLDLPLLNIQVSPPYPQFAYPVITPALSPDLSVITAIASFDPEYDTFYVHPQQETPVPPTSYLSPSTSLLDRNVSHEELTPFTKMTKPNTADSTPLVDETLSYVPNITFGHNNKLPPIKAYGLPSLNGLAEWQNLFTAEVRVMPRKKEEDVLFSITLTPKKEAIAYALKQNFHFIINCSNTSRHRIPVYKKAVHRALGYLNDRQNFNIYIVDQHGAFFDELLVEANEKEIAKARDFLDKENYKSKKHKTSLLGILSEIAELPKERDELHTVILLSDGNILDKKRKREDELRMWLLTQKGKMALYAATVGDENRSIDLELFAASSGTSVLISPTHAAFARKFTKLVMDLQHPLATDVSITLQSKHPDYSLHLASTTTLLPPLFADQSFTLVGSAPKPVDFNLLLEANTSGRFIEIHKQLSLKAATKSPSSLIIPWLEKSAHEELAQFLENGGQYYLDEAAKLLGKVDKP